MVLMESRTQQASALGQHVGVALTQTLEQAGGPFDVSEEEGDCSPREVRHGGRPLPGFDTVFRGKTRRYCLLKGVCQRGGKVQHTREALLGSFGECPEHHLFDGR